MVENKDTVQKEDLKSDRFAQIFPKIDAWDKRIIKKVYKKYEGRDHYRKAAKYVSYCGDPRLWIIVLVSLGIRGLIIEDLSLLVLFATGILQSYLFYYVIKQYFARPRPFISLKSEGILRLDKTGHGYSFPSGHSHHSTILVGLFILWFGPYPGWAIVFIIIGLGLYNIAVPYSRLISGCHYPSDVIFSLIEAYLALILHWFVTAKLYIQLLDPIFSLLF
jgi:membrane-associated phospholipid phosphatase